MLKICGAKKFLEDLSNKSGVILFGAGRYLKHMEKLFAGTLDKEKIIGIIDNDQKKCGKEITVMGRKLTIHSIEQLSTLYKENMVVLITIVDYEPVLRQLKEAEELRKCICYCLVYMYLLEMEQMDIKKQLPATIKRTEIPLIPKAIHYCWFGKNPIPAQHRKWMESWKKLCPDYEIKEWNESNYDITKNKYMLQAYENEKWGFVPDFARLDIIYHYGGIYFDTDVELLKNIDDLLFQKGFAGFESDDRVAFGLGFGAVKGLPVIKKLLDFYNEMEFTDSLTGKMNMTASPIYQTQVLKESGLVANGEYQVVDDLTVFPRKVLNGRGIEQNILSNDSRAMHHYAGSWLQEDKKRQEAALKRLFVRQ